MYSSRQYAPMHGYTAVAQGLGGIAPLGAFTEVDDPNEFVKPVAPPKVKSTPTFGGGPKTSSSGKAAANIANAGGGGSSGAGAAKGKDTPGRQVEDPGTDILVTPGGGGGGTPTPTPKPGPADVPGIVHEPEHIPIVAIVAGGAAVAVALGAGIYAARRRAKRAA